MEKSQTALQLHIEMMKLEIKHMENTNVKFDLLRKLIHEASNLLTLNKMEIMQAFHDGRLQKYEPTDKQLSPLEYYKSKYETERKTEVS